MDSDQKEIAKIAAEAAMRPFADLINKLFGGPIEQIGGMWTDRLAVRRQVNRISLFRKLDTAISAAGFDPQQIPDKVWIPAVQSASLEDDGAMQEKWANLLANFADPRADAIPPSFPKILAEMSSREAKFLDQLYDHLQGPRLSLSHPMERDDLFDVYMSAGSYDADAFSVDMDSLLRNRLVESHTPVVDRDVLFSSEPIPEENEYYRLSSLGKRFVGACRAPSDAQGK